MRTDLVTLSWPTGAADIYLSAWFPAPAQRIVRLRKLLELDPVTAADTVPGILEYIESAREKAKERGLQCYKEYEDHQQVAYDASEMLLNGTHPNGLPLRPEDKKSLRELRTKEKRLADHAAAAQRRAYRDFEQLRKNAEVVKTWRF